MSRDLVKYEGMGSRAFCIRGTAGHTQRPGSKGEHGGERRGMLTLRRTQHGLRGKKEDARRVMAVMLESLILSVMEKRLTG